nr:hypothetical protein [Ochrobactrum sp. UNC390CL2Tsu3S39]
MIDDDLAAMSLEQHIEERVNAAILAERDRCANVAIQYFRGDEYNSNQRSAGAMIYVAILAGETA